jgi:hypothetical protein
MSRWGPTLVWLLLALFLGAQAGELYARAVGSHFSEPRGLDPKTWKITSPGMSQDLMLPSLGRGTMVVDGALPLSEHWAFPADRITTPPTPSRSRA